MAQPVLPADGHISDSLRTTLEVKDDLDDTLNVIRCLLGTQATAIFAIAAGALTPTAAAPIILIDAESGATDDLDTLTPGDYVSGSVVFLTARPGDTITVKHQAGGSGEFSTLTASDVDIVAGDWKAFILAGTTWYQWMQFFDTPAAWRTFLELGSAALLADGAVDAATLEGNAASYFLAAAAQAADSASVNGFDETDFVQLAVAAVQTLTGKLKTEDGRFIANNASGQSSGLEIRLNNTIRADVFVDDVDDYFTVRLYDSGATLIAAFRFDQASSPPIEWYDGTSWYEIVTTKNPLDAATLNGFADTAFIKYAGIGSNSASGSVTSLNRANVTLQNRHIGFKCWGDQWCVLCMSSGGGMGVYNIHTTSTRNYNMSWEYIT